MYPRRKPLKQKYTRLENVVHSSTPKNEGENVQVSASSISDLDSPGNSTTITEMSDLCVNFKRHRISTALEESPRKKKKVMEVGKDYNSFKPLCTNSFYFQILKERKPIQELAQNWLKGFKISSNDVIMFMQQFFIDLAGCQSYDIIEASKKFNSEEIVKDLCKNLPDMLCRYTYLLNTNSNWSRHAIELIKDFLEEIVIAAHAKDDMFEYDVFGELFKFLRAMASTDIRALKHTAVYIAMQFCVPLATLLTRYEDAVLKLKRLSGNFTTDSIKLHANCHKAQTKYEILAKYNNFLLAILFKQCVVHDIDMGSLRVVSAKVFAELFFLLPKSAKKLKCLDVILLHLTDGCARVRLAAVKSLRGMLEDAEFNAEGVDMSKVLLDLAKTLLDEDLTVASSALNALTAACTHYSKFLLKETKATIVQLLYNKHHVLACAAGNFLVAFLRRRPEATEKNIFEVLVSLQVPMMTNMEAILVDSVFDSLPELRHPALIVRLILGEDFDMRKEATLLKILVHSVSLTLTGVATYPRLNSPKRKISSGAQDVTLREVVPKTAALFNKYRNENQCLEDLLFMMNVFTYDDDAFYVYEEDITEIFKILEDIFARTNEKKVLNGIMEIFAKIISSPSYLESQARISIAFVTERCAQIYRETLTDDDWTRDACSSFELTLLRLSVIMRHVKVEMDWSYDRVAKLFSAGRLEDAKIQCHDLKCGRNYLAKRIQDHLKNVDGRAIQTFDDDVEMYLDVCFKRVHPEESTQIRYKAISCIITLCQKISSSIRELTTEVDVLRTLKSKIDIQRENQIISFLQTDIFKENGNITCKKAKKFIHGVLQNTSNGTFPQTILSTLFGFYSKFYDKFGEIFDMYVARWNTTSRATLTAIVAATLSKQFQNVQSGRQASACKNVKDLRKLSLQFSRVISKESVVLLLKMILRFSSKHNAYGILNCVECFCDLPTAHEKEELLSFIRTQGLSDPEAGVFVARLKRQAKNA